MRTPDTFREVPWGSLTANERVAAEAEARAECIAEDRWLAAAEADRVRADALDALIASGGGYDPEHDDAGLQSEIRERVVCDPDLARRSDV